jgi:hypothetical protein
MSSPNILDQALDRVYVAMALDARQIALGDLRDVLAHQLDSDLEVELTHSVRPVRGTFRELFRERRPSLELLREVKSFAKRVHARPYNLPSEPYMVLYLASIVTALVRHDRMITRMSREALLANLYWTLAQSWLDPDLASLFREGIGKLETIHGSIYRTSSEAQD